MFQHQLLLIKRNNKVRGLTSFRFDIGQFIGVMFLFAKLVFAYESEKGDYFRAVPNGYDIGRKIEGNFK